MPPDPGALYRRRLGRVSVFFVFFPAADPDPLLWIAGTNGAFYGISTGDIIAQLKVWRTAYDAVVLGAGFDWANVRVGCISEDPTPLGREVAALCFDMIPRAYAAYYSEKEVNTILKPHEEAGDEAAFEAETLGRYIVQCQLVSLWWD